MKTRSIISFLLKAIGVFIVLLFLIALFSIRRVDRTPYKGSATYLKMKEKLDSLPTTPDQKGHLSVGWAKMSIIPEKALPIASYGIREKYSGVHDTVWCKTIFFDNGIEKAAFVTLDILIFPPAVLETLKEKFPIAGITFNNLFVSTSHTHNGPGGWAKGLGGRILAGPYNEEYVTQLSNTIVSTIKTAQRNMLPASIGYHEYNVPELLENRFSKKAKDIDSKLRLVKIKKNSGENACISIYAGHANTLSSRFNELSGDYAGALTQLLEQNDSIDFAAFAAGAVATHNCHYDTLKYSELTHKVAHTLYDTIIKDYNRIVLKDSITISSLKLNIPLRDPQVKIAKNWSVRPWLFYKLLGKEDVFISQLRLGSILLIGTPCDFAGGLAMPLYKKAKEKNLDLIVTSFNGGYIGYILPDAYYDMDIREPRDMDWYGPYSGSYFSEIISEMIHKSK